MATLADAYIRLRPETSKLGPEIKREGDKHGKTFGATFVRSSAGPFRAIGGILSSSIGGIVTGLAAVAGVKAFAGFIADAEESAKVAKLTASTIKATGGAAKITATQVGNLASAISNKTGKDDEAVQSGENMLLTFKNIRNEAGKGNDIFNQASTVLTDMTAAMNGGVVTQENMRKSGIQLGKALNDPIKGIGALSRVGVTFTDQQKKQITTMVKAGNTAGAQKIILGELKSEFGGAAAASSSMSDRMKVALGNLGETIGGLLLPVVDKVASFIGRTLVPRMQDFAGVVQDRVVPVFKTQVLPRLKEFGNFIRDDIVPRLKEFGQFLLTEVVPRVVDLGQAIADLLLPILKKVGSFILTYVLPALQFIGTAIVRYVIPAITTFVGWLNTAVTWLGKHKDILLAVGITLGIFAAVILASLIPAFIAWAVSAAAAAAATFLAVAPIVLVTAVVAGLVYGIIQLVKHWDTIWAHIWSFMKTIGAWFAGPFVGFFTGAWSKIVGAWNKVRDGIMAGWTFMRDKVFNPVKTFITSTIPNAFKSGVQTIGKWWDGLKAIAAKPIKFVLETVINNGIIGGINWVAGKVGVKGIPKVPIPKGLGDGPGMPEGAGDGIGDLFRGGVASVVGNPAKWLTNRISGGLGSLKKRFGDNPFTAMLAGAGKKTLGFGVDKLKSLLSFLDIGAAGRGLGGAAAGLASVAGMQPGILGVLNDLRSVFGHVGVISGYRPGATTLSGNVSYHASGRAIDIAPVLGWAQYLRYAWGPRLRELITPWNALNILNGRPHTYTGAVWNQHNFAGGNAHIHAALDDGGLRWLQPGLNVIPNGTGRVEPIAGPRAMAGMGTTYNVNVYPSPLAHPADVGKQVVQAIQAFERNNGKRWRA